MKIYVVLRRDGTVKALAGSRGRKGLYDTPGAAKRAASADGDSVVEIDADVTATEPIFIRRKVMP